MSSGPSRVAERHTLPQKQGLTSKHCSKLTQAIKVNNSVRNGGRRGRRRESELVGEEDGWMERRRTRRRCQTCVPSVFNLRVHCDKYLNIKTSLSNSP